MHVEQSRFLAGEWTPPRSGSTILQAAQLVLVFGDRATLCTGAYLESLRLRYPEAHIVSCSGGGQVMRTEVVDDGLVATAIAFQSATIRAAEVALASADHSESAGAALAAQLDGDGLRHVLVFAEGLRVNGSALARGLVQRLPDGVDVSGGLAADGEAFEHTLVGLDGVPIEGHVVAIGLYGDSLDIGIGSVAGWQPFGPDRRITRSDGNILYELDGRPALDLYKELLGPLGYALPASGLLFPLKVRATDDRAGLIRSILGVDETTRSVTFAGDVPEGWTATLVRTDLDTLITAAGSAAAQSASVAKPGLVLVVSCIGRKLLLQRRVSEELKRVEQQFDGGTVMAGFYSYGELAPSVADAPCELHNQTMTLTAIGERIA